MERQSANYSILGDPRRYVVRSEGSLLRESGAGGKEWAAARAAGLVLSDEVLLCVESIAGNVIVVRPVSYRTYFEARSRTPERFKPLAVSGYIEENGRLLVGRRPGAVTQYPGRIEAIPSGSIDDAPSDGRVDPEAALLKELEEEAGLATSVAEVGEPLLIRDWKEHTFDLCYRLRLSVPIDEALARAKQVGHYQDPRCARLSELTAQSRDLVPTTLAIVDMLMARSGRQPRR